jgi:polar amino acid transport system substrate-binding protein
VPARRRHPRRGPQRHGPFRWGLLAALPVIVLALAGAAAPAAPAAQPVVAQPVVAQPAAKALRVGIKPLDPFVVQDSPGHYSGFSIELWDEIARRNGWTTTYVWHEGLPALLADVQHAKVDAGIAGISITPDREQVLDFSYPMFNAGLEVMARRTTTSNWTSELSGFVTAGVGRYLLALIVALVLAGNVVWLAARVRARLDGTPRQKYLSGVGLGMFKAAGVGLVGDFGVGDPSRPVSRFVSIGWSIVGVCFVSLFTAAVTTQLTVQSIQTGISGLQDLAGHHIVTVAGSSAQRYLAQHQYAFTTVPSIEKAYPLLDDGKADAIVFDSPVLEHRTQVSPGNLEVIVGGVFAHEDYGIAFPTGSALRKKVNTTILAMQSDGSYDRIYEHYFGAATGR